MQVVWTEAALADLEDILAYTAENYPALVAPVERRIRDVVARIPLARQRAAGGRPTRRAGGATHPLSLSRVLSGAGWQG